MPTAITFGSIAARAFGFLGRVLRKDAFFNYVTLLLTGNGTNGAQNNTFLDSSTNNFTITRNGNTTQGTFTPYGSNWSNYFDGSTTQLSTASNAAFTLGSSGDFTIESWVFANGSQSTAPAMVLTTFADWNTNYTNRWAISISGTTLSWFNDAGGFGVSTTITPNVWFHVAVVRSGSTITMYLNGSSVGTQTTNQAYTTQGSVKIGFLTQAGYFNGYLSNTRVVKGTAVYTSNFTPPTAPLTAITNTSLLTCQSNRFIDNSSNAFALTVNGSPSVQRFSPFNPTAAYAAGTIGGSGYFDGSGDFLDAASNAAFGYGTGDFQFDYLVYLNNKGSSQTIQEQRIGIDQAPVIDIGSDGSIAYYKNASSGTLVVAAGAGSIRWLEWSLITVSRVSGTSRIFVNGVSLASAADSTNYAQAPLRIGANLAGGAGVSGYIAQCRVVKGSGVSSTFTPSYPLTAISGTSLLLNFTNGGIIDNAMMNDLETVGNAQISTSVSKFGGGSLAFDGTGDYLYEPSTPNLTLGSGDFTVEMWVNPTSISATLTFLLAMRPASTNGAYPVLYADNTGTYWYVSSANRISGSVLATGVWTHIAVCRSGTSTRMFINGVQTGSTYSDSTNYLMGRLYIGASDFNSGSSEYLNGYIDDLRITKGYARYTANFTPPGPLPLQ